MAMHPLEAFMKENGLTNDSFGAKVGVSGVTVWRWANGKARPSWENVAAIEAATGGAVTFKAFVPSPQEAA